MPEKPKQRSLRIVVLISGGGSTLGNLCAYIARGALSGVEIERVISSRAAVRGLEIATAHGLPSTVVARRAYSDVAAFSEALDAAIGDPDLVVMGGFLSLWHIPARLRGRVLNIHPALLPAYGGRGMYGRHVHEAVLAGGEAESGCTVHLADDQYDHGPIVVRARIPIAGDETPESLGERVMAMEREVYPWVLAQVVERGVDWLEHTAGAGGLDYAAASSS